MSKLNGTPLSAETRELLASADASLALAMSKLDVSFTKCASCDKNHYADFHQKQTWDALDGMRQKLARLIRSGQV